MGAGPAGAYVVGAFVPVVRARRVALHRWVIATTSFITRIKGALVAVVRGAIRT